MLKKLRWKIILVNMSMACTVLLTALMVNGFVSVRAAQDRIYAGLEQAVTLVLNPNRDLITEEILEEHHERIMAKAYVAVQLQPDGGWELLEEEGVSVEEGLLQQAVLAAVRSEENLGMIHELDLAYCRQQLRDGTLLTFGDLSAVHNTVQREIVVSVVMLFVGSIVLGCISMLLATLAVRPVAEAMVQQERFVADASHALKTPLTVIMANHSIMSAHPDQTVAQQSQWMESTSEEAAQMRRLIDQMLTLAKFDADMQPVALQPVKGAELVEAQLLYLEPVAYEKGVHLKSRIAHNLCWSSDPDLLRQLTVLLLENAVKYSGRGDTVTVSLRRENGVILAVHNAGVIPPEDLPHIFDRFYRSGKTLGTQGHGLGLAIAKRISEQLHGQLTVSSTLGSGTTFRAEFRV